MRGMVAMSVPAMRKWFAVVKDDPFELALTLCSLNLAAGASDLSDLRFLDDSVQRHQPAVDITRKLFITYRSKSRVARWTKILQNTNEHAIDMMSRTHAALEAWIRHREELIDDLRKRADIPASIEQAKTARRLRERGRTLAQIAEELSVPKWKVTDLLRRPTDRRGWARSLVQQRYRVKDTAGLTGLSVGSVSNYTRDIPRDKTPRQSTPHRHARPEPRVLRSQHRTSAGRPPEAQELRARPVRPNLRPGGHRAREGRGQGSKPGLGGRVRVAQGKRPLHLQADCRHGGGHPGRG